MEEKISRKTNIEHLTFGELSELHKKNPQKYKLLYLVGTNVGTKQSEIFSCELTPDMIISDAVRISMSIPVLFKPHQCWEKINKIRRLSETRKNLYIDGGVLDNYPVWLFDYNIINGEMVKKIEKTKDFNPKTLGFRLESLNNLIAKQASSIFNQNKQNQNENLSDIGYFFSILECFYNKQESDFNLHEKNRMRTISIEDRNVPMLNFNLSSDVTNQLKKSGQDAVNNYQLPSVEPVQHNILKNYGGYAVVLLFGLTAGYWIKG